MFLNKRSPIELIIMAQILYKCYVDFKTAILKKTIQKWGTAAKMKKNDVQDPKRAAMLNQSKNSLPHYTFSSYNSISHTTDFSKYPMSHFFPKTLSKFIFENYFITRKRISVNFSLRFSLGLDRQKLKAFETCKKWFFLNLNYFTEKYCHSVPSLDFCFLKEITFRNFIISCFYHFQYARFRSYYNSICIRKTKMLNNSPNFGFPAYYGQYLPLPSYQGLHPLSYQSSYFPSYLWVEPNFNHQACQVLLTYGDQQFLNTEAYQQQAKDQSHFQMQEIHNSHRLQSQKDLLHFSPTQGRYDIQQQKWAVKPSGAFTYCSISQENQRPSPQSIESDLAMPIKADNAINNEIQVEDKKLIQNLRYQRKNIEANIVNKVYTHLKTILKFGQKSVEKLLNDREKSIIYFKVVEKLEKAKKQLIKRQFLKSLTSIDESLPGYNKVLKQLQKKGQSIQQFEYYIRVIIRNFLRNEARNSILTSRKMNPSLWIDHLRKVRELQEYLFTQDDEEELN